MKNKLKSLPLNLQFLAFLLLWIVCWLLAIFVQAIIVTAVTDGAGAAQFYNEGMKLYPAAYMLTNAVSQVGIFLLPAVLFAYLFAHQPTSFLGLTKIVQKKQLLWSVVLGVLVIPFMTSLGSLIREIDLGQAADAMQATRDAAMKTYLQSSNIGQLALNVVLLALIPAVCEELFFRGVMMKYMYALTKQPWLAFVATSIFFTILHWSVYEFVPIFLASMLLCWVYFKTNNLVNCIVLHFLNNGLQLIFLYFNSSTTEQQPANIMVYVSLLALSLAIGLLVMKQLQKVATPMPLLEKNQQ